MTISSEFLDNNQYTVEEILKYEVIYGQDFVSTGGLNTTKTFFDSITLDPDMCILDIGSGLGGSAFYLADRFGVSVHGIDLSQNMVSLSVDRLKSRSLGNLVSFTCADILLSDWDNKFNLAYSRDVFLHIHDKDKLFSQINRSLVPGGKILFSDNLCGQYEWTVEFSDYIRELRYHILTFDDYIRIIQQAGFENVTGIDKTNEFVEAHVRELERMKSVEQTPDEMNTLADGWKKKIARGRSGEQRWGWFSACKPTLEEAI
ncbi:MAG: methyltransferase domain-containing protein [Proteobacteria bacterium]|nr:methyltransferase domain-containing protein [Pseudomonadota bacterium]